MHKKCHRNHRNTHVCALVPKQGQIVAHQGGAQKCGKADGEITVPTLACGKESSFMWSSFHMIQTCGSQCFFECNSVCQSNKVSSNSDTHPQWWWQGLGNNNSHMCAHTHRNSLFPPRCPSPLLVLGTLIRRGEHQKTRQPEQREHICKK